MEQSFCECTEDKACTYVFPGINFQVSISAAGGGSEQITGARLYFTCSCLSLQYHYLSIVQINLFRARPRHSTPESQPFRFSVKVLSQSTVAMGPEKKFFVRSRSRWWRLWLVPLNCSEHCERHRIS